MKKVSTHLWVLNALLEYLRKLLCFQPIKKQPCALRFYATSCAKIDEISKICCLMFFKQNLSFFFQYCIISWYNKVFNSACRQTPLICSFLKPLLHLLVCAFRNAIPPQRGHQKISKAKCKSRGILVEMWVPSEFYWFQWSYSRFQPDKIRWEHRLQYKFSRQLISSS